LANDKEIFAQWPFIRYSLTMSILTFLWSYCLRDLFKESENAQRDGDTELIITFVLCIVPGEILLLHPGQFWINIDPGLFKLCFMQQVIHGCGFYFINKFVFKRNN